MSRSKKKPEVSNINPAHYKSGKIEALVIIKHILTTEEFKGFLQGLIVKYLIRADKKNGLEDYEKAQWYLNYLVKELEKMEVSKNASS